MDLNQIFKQHFKAWVEDHADELKAEFKGKAISEIKFLSRAEAAEYLSVSLSTIDNYVRWGLLPKYKPKKGTFTRFKKEDLDNLLIKI